MHDPHRLTHCAIIDKSSGRLPPLILIMKRPDLRHAAERAASWIKTIAERVRPVTDRIFPILARWRAWTHRRGRRIILGLAAVPTILVLHLSYRTSLQAFWSAPKDLRSVLYSLFGLPAALALLLLWAYTVSAMNRATLRIYFPQIDAWLRRAAAAAIALAALHPLSLMIALTPSRFFAFQFVAKDRLTGIMVGELALFCLLAAGLTMILIRVPLFRDRRRLVDWFCGTAFVLALVHGGMVGPASRIIEAQVLWGLYLTTAVAALAYRLKRG